MWYRGGRICGIEVVDYMVYKVHLGVMSECFPQIRVQNFSSVY